MSESENKATDTELEDAPSFDFLLDSDSQPLINDHRAWLKAIRHERPLPKKQYKVAVYIRYFNQTKYEDYLSFHKKQFLETISLCPNWVFQGFYIDEGASPPHMENAQAWSELLNDCYEGKVDLIITQKVSNVSKKRDEVTFCARLLAALRNPVGIYFVSEDIFTLASYYMEDLHDNCFFPYSDWKLLPDEENAARGVLND